MSSDVLLVITVMVVVLLAGFAFLAWWLKKASSPQANQEQLLAMVNQVFGLSSQKFIEQNQQVLRSEKELIQLDLDNKQRTIENLVKQLQEDLKVRQGEIRVLEQDRSQKFSELKTVMEQHRIETDQLRITTQQLATVLSNNQTRGEWGERIIEDLMRANGLVEGVHYLKQQRQETSNLRPDITLLLPNKRNVPVDVKFPYSEIQKMAVAETTSAKQAHFKQFSSDVKIKIAKVAEYIDPSQNTLDYAILFVPNEMIFSFINQRFPDLIDEALAKRVLIVSPFTFLIVARTIMESYRNFMLSDKLKDVVKAVDDFTKEWDTFKLKFDKYGRTLETLRQDYDELSTTRVRQMEKKITKIGKLQSGSSLELEETISE